MESCSKAGGNGDRSLVPQFYYYNSLNRLVKLRLRAILGLPNQTKEWGTDLIFKAYG